MAAPQLERVYFPNLDGLRFFCFLSVFLFHSFHSDIPSLQSLQALSVIRRIFSNGNLGVNFFFVLSGFLITYLLILEKNAFGKIDVLSFWIRRVLRIWPLYFFCVWFGFAAFPRLKLLLGTSAPNETANILAYLTFTSNFDMIRNGLPDSSVLGVLWSIAIEEQFYFFWPLLMSRISTNRYPYLFGGIIAVSVVFRGVTTSPLLLEFHTLSCIGDMAVGGMAAFMMTREIWLRRAKNLSRWAIVGVYTLFIAAFLGKDLIPEARLWIAIERGIVASIIALIIVEQNFSKHSFFKVSALRRISELGKVTYGLYCLHFIGILTVLTLTRKLGLNSKLWQVVILEPVLSLLLTVAISLLSYHYFEKFFLGLKSRFAYVDSSPPSSMPEVGVTT